MNNKTFTAPDCANCASRHTWVFADLDKDELQQLHCKKDVISTNQAILFLMKAAILPACIAFIKEK